MTGVSILLLCVVTFISIWRIGVLENEVAQLKEAVTHKAEEVAVNMAAKLNDEDFQA
jgi:hypothetical protein